MAKKTRRKNVLLIMAALIIIILLYTLIRFDYFENPDRYIKKYTLKNVIERERVRHSKNDLKIEQGIQSAALIIIVLVGGAIALKFLKEK